MSCLSFDELIELLLSDRAIDDRLRQKIVDRAAGTFGKLPAARRRRAATRLVQLMTVTPYTRRVTVEYLLELVYAQVPSPTRGLILRMFLDSHMRSRRKRAYRMMRQDRGIRWRPLLAQAWRTWRDRDAALLIVDQFESGFLVKHFDKLASDLDETGGIPKLFLRVASECPSVLPKLRQYDGITYAYVCARLSTAITRTEAKSLLNEYRNDARLGILAWCFGNFGHWKLLVDLSEEVQDIERKQQMEQYNRMGLSSEVICSLTQQGPNGA